ncbi:MAG: hypothetical protein RLZZ86_1267, partial [Cyanobacteriota bacterium]
LLHSQSPPSWTKYGDLGCDAPKFYNPNIAKSCGAGILPARIIQLEL